MIILEYFKKFVTGFGKTLRMGFFQKIEFDAWLISSSIELTHVQVLGRSHTLLLRYSALFVITPHPRNYGLKALLCMRMAFPHRRRQQQLEERLIGSKRHCYACVWRFRIVEDSNRRKVD